jgi:hypothetical protein
MNRNRIQKRRTADERRLTQISQGQTLDESAMQASGDGLSRIISGLLASPRFICVNLRSSAVEGL